MTNYVKESYLSDKYENDGTHFVLWSGGCDSTLLLYELLDAYGSNNVVAVSYKYPWLSEHKCTSETKYRSLFKEKMNKLGGNFANVRHMEIEISDKMVSGEPMYVKGGGLPQSIAWLLSIPLYANKISYVYDGTIHNDDLVLNLSQYQQIFQCISEILNRRLILRQPYLRYTKATIIEKLIARGIYDCTWFCELPIHKNKICTKCIPCKTHISALSEISIVGEDPDIRGKAKIILNDIIARNYFG